MSDPEIRSPLAVSPSKARRVFPPPFTPASRQRVLSALARGESIEQAAQGAGTSTEPVVVVIRELARKELGEAIEKAYKPKAEAARAEGGKQGGKKAGRGRPANRDGESFPKPNRDETKRTTAQATAELGDVLSVEPPEIERRLTAAAKAFCMEVPP